TYATQSAAAGSAVTNVLTEPQEPGLIDAAAAGDIDQARTLLEAGVDPDLVRADDGATALMLAAQEGHTDITQLLIDEGAWTDRQGRDGLGALIQASQNGHEQDVFALLAAGATPDLARDD